MNKQTESALELIPKPETTYSAFFSTAIVWCVITIVITLALTALFGFLQLTAFAPWALLLGMFRLVSLIPNISRFKNSILGIGHQDDMTDKVVKVIGFFAVYMGVVYLFDGFLSDFSNETLVVLAFLWFIILFCAFRGIAAVFQMFQARNRLAVFLDVDKELISKQAAWRIRLLVSCLEDLPEETFTWDRVKTQLSTDQERLLFLSEANHKIIGGNLSGLQNVKLPQIETSDATRPATSVKTENHYSAEDINDMLTLDLSPGFSESDLQNRLMSLLKETNNQGESRTSSEAIREAYDRLMRRFSSNLNR